MNKDYNSFDDLPECVQLFLVYSLLGKILQIAKKAYFELEEKQENKINPV